jgi:hypothetical protein
VGTYRDVEPHQLPRIRSVENLEHEQRAVKWPADPERFVCRTVRADARDRIDQIRGLADTVWLDVDQYTAYLTVNCHTAKGTAAEAFTTTPATPTV